MTTTNFGRAVIASATAAQRDAVAVIIIEQMIDAIIERGVDPVDREAGLRALYDEGFRSPSLDHCGEAALAEAARRRG